MSSKLLTAVGLTLGTVLTGVSVITMAQEGYVAIFTSALHSWSSLQVFTDLTVSLTLLCAFIIADARKHGHNPWPYLIATPFVGSFGPLAYLGVRAWTVASTTRRAAGA